MHVANSLNFIAASAVWPWLFPATYLVHIAEEYWGGEGFRAHLSKTKGFDLTPLRFFFMAAFGLVLMIAGIVLAERFKFPQLALVILGAAVLANGLSHTASGVARAEYNPGLLTAILLWIPQGALTLAGLSGSMSGGRYLVGVLIGMGVQVAATLLSLSGGKSSKARREARPDESLQPDPR